VEDPTGGWSPEVRRRRSRTVRRRRSRIIPKSPEVDEENEGERQRARLRGERVSDETGPMGERATRF
jgi:hypothetical protein